MKLLFRMQAASVLGGMEIVLGSLIGALTKKGIPCFLSAGNGPATSYLVARGATLVDDNLSKLGPMPWYRSILKRVRPTLVVSVQDNIDFVYSNRLLGFPIVSIFGGAKEFCLAEPLIFDLTIALSDVIVVPSAFVKSDFEGSDTLDKIRYIYNGIDTHKFAPSRSHKRGSVRKALGISTGDFVIGCSARFDFQKRHRELIHAFSKVSKRMPNSHLVLVGRWDSGEAQLVWNDLRDLMTNYSTELQQRIHFVSSNPANVPFFLATMDLFVFPAMNEGLGCAILEAMAMELPVIVANSGGAKEPLLIEKCGYLFQPDESDALCDRIWDLYRSPKRRKEFGRVARRVIQNHFSVNTMVEEYYRTFRAVACQSR